MPHNPISWWRHHRAARDARHEYWRLEASEAPLWNRLAADRTTWGRAMVLPALSESTLKRANIHTQAFGADPVPGGTRTIDMAESLAYEALVLSALGAVETLVASGNRAPVDWYEYRDLGPRAADLLNTMIANPESRTHLLDGLYAAVYPHIGGQAAEVITAVMRRLGEDPW